ncbi:MAG: hypothetical protein AB7S46_07925 [Flavobacteriaceae bacterium]
MLAREMLQGAVEAGILTSEQADGLSAYLAERETLRDPEKVRFTHGFHDIFIGIGIVILLVGIGLSNNIAAAPFAAITIWILAEWLSRLRRAAFPSLILTLAFPLFAGLTLALAIGGLPINVTAVMLFSNAQAAVLFGVAALTGALAFYWRFNTPISLALIAGSAIVLVIALLELASPGITARWLAAETLVAGLGCFLLAMRYDSRDTSRRTINTDKAFWLHLMAAPLVIHSSVSYLQNAGSGSLSAAVLIAFVLVMGLVALVVDRRALLVSGLAYLGVAVVRLMMSASMDANLAIPAALVAVGLFVLLVGSAWASLRRTILAPFAGTPLLRFVPSPTRNIVHD